MDTLDPKTLKKRLLALAAGVVVALGLCGGLALALPDQSAVPEGITYDYVYSGAKSSSPSFTLASMTPDSVLVFGSSELSTSPNLIAQVPYNVFGAGKHGLSLTYVGEAYDQSLWHAIAAGAYGAEDLATRKVVILVGPSWFEDGGLDESTFELRFSFELWQSFCANEAIPQELKERVAERLAAQGVESALIDAGLAQLPQDVLNAWAFSAMDDLKLRGDLQTVRRDKLALEATATSVETLAPDFEALRSQATADYEAKSSTNDWGVENEFWTERLEPVLKSAKDSRANETLQDTPEYDDLALLLEVCEATHLEPLVVIEPLLGPYYDHIGVDAQKRAACYERIRQICHEAGVEVADFSSHEYEPGYLFDIVHFGWKGWVDVEEAIWNFIKGGAS